jgi:hypothetical protein
MMCLELKSRAFVVIVGLWRINQRHSKTMSRSARRQRLSWVNILSLWLILADLALDDKGRIEPGGDERFDSIRECPDQVDCVGMPAPAKLI